MIVELNELTLPQLLERSYKLYAANPCLGRVGEQPITYEELSKRVRDLSESLVSEGIKKGDRAVILGENSPEWVIAYLAVTSAGMVAVPVLPGFPDTDVRHIISNSDAKVLFIEKKYLPKTEGEKSDIQILYMLEDFSIVHTGQKGLVARVKDALHKNKAAGSPKKSAGQIKLPAPKPEDLAVIIFTSGTTGNSKGVMLTHHNIVSDIVNSIERFPIHPSDIFLSIIPLAHTFEATGGMLCPIAVGSSIYYMKGLPTPQNLLTSMETARPTGVLTVPLVMDKIYRKRILPKLEEKTLTRKLYHIPAFRKRLNHIAGKKLIKSLGGRLRFFMFGGASLNEDVETFLRDAKISYSTGYGMTETSPIMTINPFGKVKVGSCGKPIPGIEMRINEPDPVTHIGEITVRGPIVMQGYYKNEKATKETFLQKEWLKTGDLGYFDDEGYLFIKGRSKNVIIGPSGENIYPENIEELLLKNPVIQQAIVYDMKGKIVAKIYLDPDLLDKSYGLSDVSNEKAGDAIEKILEEIRVGINPQLPSFSALNKIYRQPEPFELTPTNKVKRFLYISG